MPRAVPRLSNPDSSKLAGPSTGGLPFRPDGSLVTKAMLQINGTDYRLCLLDTNAVSEMLKNREPAFRNYLTWSLRDDRPTFVPAFSLFTIIELRQSPAVYEQFTDVFSTVPCLLLKSREQLLEEEIRLYPDPSALDPSLLGFAGPLSTEGGSLAEVLDEFFATEEGQDQERGWNEGRQDVVRGIASLVSNFQPAGTGYTAREVRTFLEIAGYQQVAMMEFDFAQSMRDQGEAVMIDAFPSIKASTLTSSSSSTLTGSDGPTSRMRTTSSSPRQPRTWTPSSPRTIRLRPLGRCAALTISWASWWCSPSETFEELGHPHEPGRGPRGLPGTTLPRALAGYAATRQLAPAWTAFADVPQSGMPAYPGRSKATRHSQFLHCRLRASGQLARRCHRRRTPLDGDRLADAHLDRAAWGASILRLRDEGGVSRRRARRRSRSAAAERSCRRHDVRWRSTLRAAARG